MTDEGKTQKELINDIVKSYNTTPRWSTQALNRITKYFLLRKNNKSKDDVNAIQAQVRTISNIRRILYSSMKPINDKFKNRWDEVNDKSIRELSDVERQKVEVNLALFKFKKNTEYNQLLKTRINTKLATNAVSEISIKEFITKVREIIDEPKLYDYYQLLVALCLISGRRQNEIHSLMKFKKIYNQHGTKKTLVEYKVNCSNFSKDRSNLTLDIPILCHVDKFLSGIDVLRSNALSDKNINLFNHQLNSACKKIFPQVKTTHKLRMIYAGICDTLFNVDPKIQSLQYKSTILGHTNITTTAEHYDSVKPIDIITDTQIKAFLRKYF